MKISKEKFMVALIVLVAIGYVIGIGIGMEVFF